MINRDVEFPFDGIDWTDNTEKHFVGRCPFCGDSTNHKHKGHLYISKSKPVFICHRCSYSGNISEIEKLLNEKCKFVYTKTNSFDYKKINVKELKKRNEKYDNEITESISDEEFKYFCDRCDLNDDKKTIMKFFNIVPQKLVSKLFPQTNFNFISNRIWFRSSLGFVYIGRTIIDDKIRYMKLNSIDGESENSIVDSYIINLKDLNKIPDTLVIAEGIFDIISIFLNYKKYKLPKNAIYSACMGSFYYRSEKTFMELFSSKPKNIKIFADKGIKIEDLKMQFKSKLPYQNISVFYPTVKDWNPAEAISMKFEM